MYQRGEGLALLMVLGMMPSCLPLGPCGLEDDDVGSRRLAPQGHVVADLVTSVLLTSLTGIT